MNPRERERTLRSWLLTYGGMLRRLASAFAFRQADVDDLLQEIALQLWQSLVRYDPSRKAEKTWVYQVGLRTAMTWRKREKYRRHQALETVPETTDASPGEYTRQADRHRWLRGQLAQLKMRDRSLLLLHLEGLSYHEISEVTGLSESNVGVLLSRLRNTLTTQAKEVIDELR